jgi:hypothetical protein
MALAIGLFSHPYETCQKSANFADPKQINLGRSRVLVVKVILLGSSTPGHVAALINIPFG